MKYRNILKSVTDKNLDDEIPNLLKNERNEKIHWKDQVISILCKSRDFIEKIKSGLTNVETNLQYKKRQTPQ